MQNYLKVWHYCQPDGRHDRFLCPNGTLFNQETRVCDWWYNVQCHSSPFKYDINGDLYGTHLYGALHKTYIPINSVSAPVLDPLEAPLAYQREINPYNAIGSVVFAESKSSPQRTIKKLRKVRVKPKSEKKSDVK